MHIAESANTNKKEKQPKLSNQFRFSCLSLLTILSILGIVKDACANTLIKKGASGAEVNNIQSRLRKLGYFPEKPSGFFGKLTEEAVKKFQKAKGLDVDGIVGIKTHSLLFETVPAVSYNPTSKASKLPATPVRLKVPALPPSNYQPNRIDSRARVKPKSRGKVTDQTSKSYLFSAQVFRKGDRGQGIKMLQEELKQRGFYSGEVDGIYGEYTEKAVIQLQMHHNLAVDGMVGSQTLALLRS